ncbi:MAG: cyclomaltodextrinase C-terminal domain-containing protein, partial [Paramuribaculum sp.]|nr:cyclomaltodextrinase C-terminal domain-containing protein [Paramuribaculum sp.]
TYPYADFNAMAEWCRDVEREYPDFNIVGECWYAHEAPEGFWQRGSRINRLGDPGLPTVMDFKLMTIARDAFTQETGPWTTNGLNEIYNHLGFDFMLADPKRILTFLDNHDTDRFLLEMPDDLSQWKQAQTFLLTSRGIPQIYYGTELLMHGSKEGSDGFIRLNVPEAEFTSEGRTDIQNEAYDFMSTLLNWRKAHRDFFKSVLLKHFAPVGTVYAYSLTSDAAPGELFVILNGSDEEAEADTSAWSEALKGRTHFTNALTGEEVEVTPVMTLAPRASLILQ